jgi:hypothetical protein
MSPRARPASPPPRRRTAPVYRDVRVYTAPSAGGKPGPESSRWRAGEWPGGEGYRDAPWGDGPRNVGAGPRPPQLLGDPVNRWLCSAQPCRGHRANTYRH